RVAYAGATLDEERAGACTDGLAAPGVDPPTARATPAGTSGGPAGRTWRGATAVVAAAGRGTPVGSSGGPAGRCGCPALAASAAAPPNCRNRGCTSGGPTGRSRHAPCPPAPPF